MAGILPNGHRTHPAPFGSFVQLDTPAAGMAALNFQAEAARLFAEDSAELARDLPPPPHWWNSVHRERQFRTA
jgi:hypothetical protein